MKKMYLPIMFKAVACFMFLFCYLASSAQLYSDGNNLISGTKVGIGTNTPSTSLFVKPPSYLYNASKKRSAFQVDYFDCPSANYLCSYKPAIFVKWDGLIGIHTSDPLEAFHINSTVRGGDTNGSLKIQTDDGYVKIGAINPTYMHFYSDLPRFYFSKRIIVDEGIISSHNEDLQLQTSETTRITVKNSTGDVVINGGSLIIEGTNASTPGVNEIKLDADDGLIRAREVKVDLAAIPDYVFDEDYNLMPLNDVKMFIEANKHLPNVKSEAEFIEEGSISLSEMNLKLLEKVEELTLYIIQIQEEVNDLKIQVAEN